MLWEFYNSSFVQLILLFTSSQIDILPSQEMTDWSSEKDKTKLFSECISIYHSVSQPESKFFVKKFWIRRDL